MPVKVTTNTQGMAKPLKSFKRIGSVQTVGTQAMINSREIYVPRVAFFLRHQCLPLFVPNVGRRITSKMLTAIFRSVENRVMLIHVYDGKREFLPKNFGALIG